MKTEYLLQREVDLVLSALTPTNRLVMRTALVTGLRVGDVLALTPDRLKPHFWVTEQKTGKARQVGLPEPLLSDLRKQSAYFLDGNSTFFLNVFSYGLSSNLIHVYVSGNHPCYPFYIS